jgi:hypothetical protein
LHGIHKAKVLLDGEREAEALNKIQTLEHKGKSASSPSVLKIKKKAKSL